MTTPRGSYGGGYGGYPSSASFPDTPIYDSLVAERGTPQIAPIRVPSPYSSYEPAGYNSFGGGSNLPALPAALPALPSGPSAQMHQPQYQQPQPQQQMQPQPGYPAGGYPQPAPAPYIPQQAAAAPRGGYNGYGNGAGYPAQAPQQSPSGYEAARPVPPRPVPPRQVPGGHPEEQYPRRNLGQGYYQG
jgi:hypothetical protein